MASSSTCKSSSSPSYYIGRKLSFGAVLITLVLVSSILPSRASHIQHGWLIRKSRHPSQATYRFGSARPRLPNHPTTTDIVTKLRGGKSGESENEVAEKGSEEDVQSDDDDDAEDEAEEPEVEEISEDDDDQDEEQDDDVEEEDYAVEVEDEAESDATAPVEYDEPYFIPQSLQLGVTVGCMFISQKVDLFNPTIIRLLRFLYIAQVLVQQALVLYVRVMAKKNNDQRSVVTQNALSGMIQSQLSQKDGSDGGNGMVKNLASSLLSSTSTVMDYDRREAHNMQGQVIFAMVFMWFLHFKMGQVQPLLIQTINDILKLVYSPLFQVYVLGRNLERPFKSQLSMNEKDGGISEDGKEEVDEVQVDEPDDGDNEEDGDDDESEDDDDESDVEDDDVLKDDEGDDVDEDTDYDDDEEDDAQE